MKNCFIIQNGSDGLGHQLHGLLSLIILNGCKKGDKKYVFVPDEYVKKKFEIAHLGEVEKKQAIDYLKFSVSKLEKKDRKFKKTIHSHEIYKIPKNHSENILYSLDNAYYFERVGLDREGETLRNNNLQKMKHIFLNDKLPKPSPGRNIVIHVRLGDSVNREKNSESRILLGMLVEKLTTEYPMHNIHIHSDGKPDFIKCNFILHDSKTPILQVISDMIYADILVCGVSSLSYFCSFLNQGSLILTPDGVKHSLPDRSFSYRDFIFKDKILKLGTNYGRWYIPKIAEINSESIVYCGGCGEDISFDLYLSHKYNPKLYLIDPTPRAYSHYKDILDYYNGVKSVKDFGGDIQKDYESFIKNLNPSFENIKFLNIGLWDKSDTLKFFKPVNQKHVSSTFIEGIASEKYEEAKVKSIKNIMEEEGHDHIDLLKLDIEGSEIKTVNQMLDDGIYPHYLLVEFILKQKNMDKKGETDQLLKRLYQKYMIMNVHNMSITFIKK